MSLLDFVWGTRTRMAVTSTCGALTAMFAVITQAPSAYETWDEQNLPTPATRTWVRTTKTAQIKSLEIDIAHGKLESAQRDLDKLELDYLKAASEQERVLNKQAQRRTQATIDAIQSQINSITK